MYFGVLLTLVTGLTILYLLFTRVLSSLLLALLSLEVFLSVDVFFLDGLLLCKLTTTFLPALILFITAGCVGVVRKKSPATVVSCTLAITFTAVRIIRGFVLPSTSLEVDHSRLTHGLSLVTLDLALTMALLTPLIFLISIILSVGKRLDDNGFMAALVPDLFDMVPMLILGPKGLDGSGYQRARQWGLSILTGKNVSRLLSLFLLYASWSAVTAPAAEGWLYNGQDTILDQALKWLLQAVGRTS